MARLLCVLGFHQWPKQWRHDGKYIESFDARVQWCMRRGCLAARRSNPISGGAIHGRGKAARDD